MCQVPPSKVPKAQLGAGILPSSFDLACFSQISSAPHPEEVSHFSLDTGVTAFAAATWGRAVFSTV